MGSEALRFLLLLLLLQSTCIDRSLSSSFSQPSRPFFFYHLKASSFLSAALRADGRGLGWTVRRGSPCSSRRSSSSCCSLIRHCMRQAAAVSFFVQRTPVSRLWRMSEASPILAAARAANTPAGTAIASSAFSTLLELPAASLIQRHLRPSVPPAAAANATATGAAAAAVASAARIASASYGNRVQPMVTFPAAATKEEEMQEELKGPSAEAVAAAAARAPAAAAAGVTLKLTPGEEHLFSSLNKCVLDKHLNIDLRAAGGWVRDKLLGIPSKDIDIAIDNMTGAAFADILNQWLAEQGCSPRAYGVISKKVEQSKHLETATLRLFSFDLDLVNLRSEAYSSSSRIPTITTLGTPLEDAARRDFCCNALFYNLKSGVVEDWLGKGLTDLKQGLVRAAHQCPYTTLRDDPLRLLRGVRFAVALRFKLHAPLAVAAAAADVHEALGAKVARERIGIELKKIFSVTRAGARAAAAAEAAADKSGEVATASVPPEAAAAAKPSAATSSRDDLLQGPLNAALRGVLLLQQIGVWDTVVSLTEGQEVYRQPEEEQAPSQEGGASAAGKTRLGQKAFVQMLKTTQKKPITIKEGYPHMDSLGASCLLALRHLLAQGPLLQQMEVENKAAETEAAALSEAETFKICDALTQGLVFHGGDDLLRQMLFAAVLHPLRGLLAISDTAPRVRSVAGSVVSSSWKLPSAEAAAVESLIETAASLRSAADRENELQQQEQQQPERVRLGLLVRKAGPQWSAALILAAAEALGALVSEDTAAAVAAASAALKRGQGLASAAAAASAAEEGQGESERKRSSEREEPRDQKKLCCSGVGHLTSCTLPHDGAHGNAAAENGGPDEVAPEVSIAGLDWLLLKRQAEAKETLQRLLHLRTRIEALGLQEAWRLQPLLNGKQAVDSFNHSLDSCLVGYRVLHLLLLQRSWQLANPAGSADECVEHLKDIYKDLTKGPLKASLMLLLRCWRGSRVASGAAVTGHRCDYRGFSAVNSSQARGGKRGPREAVRGAPFFGPSRRGQTAAGRGSERNDAFYNQLSSDKATTRFPSRSFHPQERFPRPDLDVEGLREEQRNAQGASQWKVVTVTTKAEFERPAAAVGFAETTASLPSALALRAGAPGYHVPSDEGDSSQPSAGEQLEKIRADRRARRPPAPCLYDGGTLPIYGGFTAIGAEQSRPSEENSPGCSSARAIGTFFSEGPTDWRLEITEDFDAEWSRLSGGAWDEDAGGPPWGPLADRLKDKRLKVFVPELGGARKAVAALNRYQVLGVFENPSKALDLSMDQRSIQGASSSLTLPPEVYEALVERMTKILPSFDRQQVLKLVFLQEQHVHALQQQYLLLLQRARTLRLQAAVAAEQEQQQEHQQLSTAKAVESEAAAAAAKRSLKALQQRLLLDQLFDALLPHLAWASLPKGKGLPMYNRDLASKALMVLQPFVVGSLRVMAAGAARRHRSPETACSSLISDEGSLAGIGGAPEDVGGALGFACRRLLEAICEDSALQEVRLSKALTAQGQRCCLKLLSLSHRTTASLGLHVLQLQYLPRGLLLQLLLCCCSVGSGASSAAYKVAKQCIHLLLEGPHEKGVSWKEACGGSAFSEIREISVEEAIRILISCSYLETRGGPPTWQLPLFKQLLGGPPSGAESLNEAEGSQLLCIKSHGAILGPPLLLRCSPRFVCSRSRPSALLFNQQIETLINVIEKALPFRASLENALSGFPLLRGDGQQLIQGAAVGGWRHFAESLADETVDLEGGLEVWAITVEVRSPREPCSLAPFEYLKEDEGEQAHVKEAAIPAAVALAATEAVAWALSRLLQLQHQHQAEHELQHQMSQQQRLQESIRKTLGLLELLASRLAASTVDPRVSPSAFIQGAHALADAAENLLSAFAAPCHKSALQMRELRVATLALFQAAASLLLTAAARAAQGRDVPQAFMKADIEAVCCCISRSFGALRVLRPHAHSQEKSLDGDAERAAVAAFVSAAKDCLRCCRPTTSLDETQQTSVSFHETREGEGAASFFQASDRGHLLRGTVEGCLQEQSHDGFEVTYLKEISEEVAYVLLATIATWGSPEEPGKLLQAERDPQTIVGVLDAFLTCAQPLMRKGLSPSSGTFALSSKAAASATTGLERMLKQLSRLLPLVSESELRAAAKVTSCLQQLQQELKLKTDSQAASLSSAKGAREVLRAAVEALDTGLLDQLIYGGHGEGKPHSLSSR
ncbi:hypothetical protein Emag_004320 [Eimeria magna]